MSKLKTILGKSLLHTVEVMVALAVFLLAGYIALTVLGLDVKSELSMMFLALLGLLGVGSAKAYREGSGNDYVNER